MGYLRGENLSRDIEYRICLLLAKWFYEQGDTTVLQIRNHLKEWAIKNDFYFNVAMNPVASRVIADNMKLLGANTVYISSEDISEIVNRFDTYYERMVALAVLCYGKIYADKDGKFKLSKRALGHWLGFNQKTIKKYIDNLINLDYISMYEEGGLSSWYNKTVISQLNTYSLSVNYENTGEYKLIENDIASLYAEIFLGHVQEEETWTRIQGYNDWYSVSNLGRVEVMAREIGDRIFPAKILRPFKSKSGKIYYNLMGEDNKQKKVSLDKLQLLAVKK